jgi:hypothetical protein
MHRRNRKVLWINGRISATIVTDGSNVDTLRNDLAALIRYAKALQAETRVSVVNGSDVPVDRFWATEATHEAFRTAIDIAQATLDESLYFSRGETFDIVIRIDDNTGFAGMMLRLGIPPELELVGMQLNPLLHDGFRGMNGWDGVYNINPPIINNAFAGWSRATNFSSNGELITYTLRVRENAEVGITAPITLSFANAMSPYFEPPTDVNGDDLTITLPGGVTEVNAVVEIGRITVGH